MAPISNNNLALPGKSIHPETIKHKDGLLDLLESELKTLTLEAQTIISQQSRATQLKLTRETRQLFDNYRQSGSMARLKVGLDKFMSQGNESGTIQFNRLGPDPNSRIYQQEDGQDNNERPHYGAAFMLDLTAHDDVPFRVPADSTPSHPLRIIDPDSTSCVTTLPWDPLAMQIVWPRNLNLQPGGLSMINKILSIADHECRERLFHHVCTYGPSPIFRAGIAARARTNYSTMFETADEHFVGLTPESRSFLRAVYEKHSNLNSAETRLLARMCRVDRDSVDLLWEHLTTERKPYTAMKIFVMAREIEKGRRAEAREKKQAASRAAQKQKGTAILEMR